MEFSANTPTRQKSIGELVVTVPQPFTAGPRELTEGEAAALNQVIAENLGNNLRAKFAAGITEGEGESATTRPYTPEEAQAVVDEYLARYEMGVRQVGSGESRVVDPVEREARKLAKDKAKELVKNAGRKQSEVNLTEIADTIYDQNIEALTAAAKKIVDQRRKASSVTDALDISGLGDFAPATDEGEGEEG